MNKNIIYHPERTCVSQVSKGLKILTEFENIKINLDYGGGKYDLGTKYLEKYGIQNLIYDKYNKSYEHNLNILTFTELNKPDSVTLLNVLNVIKEKKERLYCINHSFELLKDGGILIITVYKGNSKGIGTMSKRLTWQENRKLITYIEEIKEVLGEVNLTIQKNYILIKK